ncbi:hypothetical protein H4R33_003135 [Dimargaris cristalligena]|uniref:Uncharacterized protein n=1 Tax=Dimargaris cristalligena TaxID=215637 RepID=A0A4P9ZRP1_9FUNG|nr:hypothetical protein H4R33_003135 [Dimargaris cristalligena]RKP36077.1 hypothetical protein BJ085DRAFT_31613 [Dimargaris cristalligena]|eukprot:RKP36077.1 hypothetical protein BJ085DRAFT_31613 [Dimargaris cristalligena]
MPRLHRPELRPPTRSSPSSPPALATKSSPALVSTLGVSDPDGDDAPPPYSSLFADSIDPTKRPPHSSPATFRPKPRGRPFDSFVPTPTAAEAPAALADSHSTVPVSNDHLFYGRIQELEDLVSSVQHTLYSQTRAYRDVTSQLSEINQALSRIRPPSPAAVGVDSPLESPTLPVDAPTTPLPSSKPFTAHSTPGKTTPQANHLNAYTVNIEDANNDDNDNDGDNDDDDDDDVLLRTLLNDLDLSFTPPPTTPTPRPRARITRPSPPLSTRRSSLAGEPDDDEAYSRINNMLQSLIDNASEAIQNTSMPTLDAQDIALAEKHDEYLSAYGKQLAVARAPGLGSSPHRQATGPGTSPMGEEAEAESTVTDLEDLLMDSDSGSTSDPLATDNVEVQFWCKVVKKSQVIQESLGKLRPGRTPAEDLVLSEHQLQNSFMMPLMTAASPHQPLPSPFSPTISANAKYSNDQSPTTSRASVGTLRTSLRRSLIGTKLPFDSSPAPKHPAPSPTASAYRLLRRRRTMPTRSDGDSTLASVAATPSTADDLMIASLRRSSEAGALVDLAYGGEVGAPRDTTRNFVTMLYWTLLFTIGAILLDSFICNVAGHQVLGLIDQIHAGQEEGGDGVDCISDDESERETIAKAPSHFPLNDEVDANPIVTEPSAEGYDPLRHIIDAYPSDFEDNLIIEELEE